MSKTIIFSFGSNLGIRRANIERAIYLLSQSKSIDTSSIRISSIYETPALLPQNAPKEWNIPYLNAVCIAELSADVKADESMAVKLLHIVKNIESQIGRKASPNWSPREIDIDILSVGDVKMDNPILSIPHPLIFNRDFVLQPLMEVSANWISDNQPKNSDISDLLEPSLPIYSAAITIEKIINQYKPKKTKLVGILNITPDSFSDGGKYFSPEKAISQARQLLDDGTDIIDIGAESTRPNATALTANEEWQRLEPILSDIINLAHRQNKQVALDTYHPENAAKAINLGIDWINDVTGFENKAMIDAVKDSNCGLVMMHSLGVPADKSKVIPNDQDIIRYLTSYATKQIEHLQSKGIDLHRIIFDSGIGFGKTSKQSLDIILRANELNEIGVPLYIGHSRKSFLGIFTSNIKDKRDSLTLAFSTQLMQQNINFLRVHDIASHTKIL